MAVYSTGGVLNEIYSRFVKNSCLAGDDAKASEVKHKPTGGRWKILSYSG